MADGEILLELIITTTPLPIVECITTAVGYRRPSQSFAYRFGPCPTSERNALWDT